MSSSLMTTWDGVFTWALIQCTTRADERPATSSMLRSRRTSRRRRK
jgi:hypothetical protein